MKQTWGLHLYVLNHCVRDGVHFLTWNAIFKILLVGLGTYVFLPLFLILRDAVLWKVINIFILNDKLRKEIRRYVILTNSWNETYAGKSKITRTDKKQFII